MKIYRLMHFLPVLIMPVSYRFRDSSSQTAYFISPEQSMQLPVYQGRLTARLPEGKWRILRVGHTAVAPADTVAGQEQGLRCDKLSSETVYKLWTDWFTYVYRKADATDSAYVEVCLC